MVILINHKNRLKKNQKFPDDINIIRKKNVFKFDQAIINSYLNFDGLKIDTHHKPLKMTLILTLLFLIIL